MPLNLVANLGCTLVSLNSRNTMQTESSYFVHTGRSTKHIGPNCFVRLGLGLGEGFLIFSSKNSLSIEAVLKRSPLNGTCMMTISFCWAMVFLYLFYGFFCSKSVFSFDFCIYLYFLYFYSQLIACRYRSNLLIFPCVIKTTWSIFLSFFFLT